MSISNYLENKIITDSISNAGKFLAAHTADPTDTGTVGEVSTLGFTRVACTFVAPTNGVTSNTADILWTGLTYVGTISHVSIWDAATGGNCLWTGALTASKTLASADELKIAASTLTITID